MLAVAIVVSTLAAAFLIWIIIEVSITRTTPFIWNFFVKKVDHRWVQWRKGFIIFSQCPYFTKYLVLVGDTDMNGTNHYLKRSCQLSFWLGIRNKIKPIKLFEGDVVLVLCSNPIFDEWKIFRIVKLNSAQFEQKNYSNIQN
ncbi:hypothetical protein [Mycoplasma suis]|uniref:Uncharacterized protein n=1 Tax=Mycoplasma suis (strain Illinois) TaxID=768700 RepID=F0QR57_MYCSL|nr:hypothetical protein [Mycoplasma suis]ADX97977.1 hypothetical protein MSU_0441 [Mycoplasma suis str. Illinois]